MSIGREAFVRKPGGINSDFLSEDDAMLVHNKQDCQDVVDSNARLRGHKQYGTPQHGMVLGARVPDIFHYFIWPEKFKGKYGFRHDANNFTRTLWRQFYIEMLNHPDYRKFKIMDGKIPNRVKVG